MTADQTALLLAVTGRPYEQALLTALERPGSRVRVGRRCLDVVDLIASARQPAGSSLGASVAVVSSTLHRLDATALGQVTAQGVSVVAVVESGADDEAARWAAMGATATVRAPDHGEQHAVGAFVSELAAVAHSLGVRSLSGPDPGEAAPSPVAADAVRGTAGRLVAVWGACGSPGRTTVAVTLADELARLGVTTLLADADTYGPSVAQRLGVLDEASGIAAAARMANAGTLDGAALAGAAPSIDGGLHVLTGLTRADRWPELPGAALARVWQAARACATVTVVDCGFCLEEDDELSYDSVVTRRNAAALTTLEAADVVVVVGMADVVGLTRLIRGLHELGDLAERRPGAVPGDRRVVLNRSGARGVAGREAGRAGSGRPGGGRDTGAGRPVRAGSFGRRWPDPRRGRRTVARPCRVADAGDHARRRRPRRRSAHRSAQSAAAARVTSIRCERFEKFVHDQRVEVS